MFNTMLPAQQRMMEQLLKLTPNALPKASIIIAFSITGIAFVFVLVSEFLKRKSKHPIKTKIFMGIECAFFVITIMTAAYGATGINTILEASRHGLTDYNISWSKILKGIENSPTEDKLPKDITNKVILYYRFGCEDCEAIYKNLNESTKSNPNVYWVSTRSPQGKTLRDTYPVTEVPTGVYITNRQTGITKDLTMRTEKGVILNEQNLNYLLELIESNQAD